MPAKSLEGPNQVWQRVRIILSGGSSPESDLLFKGLKTWLTTQKGNPKLQMVLFNDVTVAQPTVVTSGGGTLYAVYARKGNTAVDAYLKVNDSATAAGGAAGIATVVNMPMFGAKDEALSFFQPGIPFATGFTVASETTAAGGVNSTAGDGPSGFLIIG